VESEKLGNKVNISTQYWGNNMQYFLFSRMVQVLVVEVAVVKPRQGKTIQKPCPVTSTSHRSVDNLCQAPLSGTKYVVPGEQL